MGAFLTAHSAYNRKWLRFILLPPTTAVVKWIGIYCLALLHYQITSSESLIPTFSKVNFMRDQAIMSYVIIEQHKN